MLHAVTERSFSSITIHWDGSDQQDCLDEPIYAMWCGFLRELHKGYCFWFYNQRHPVLENKCNQCDSMRIQWMSFLLNAVLYKEHAIRAELLLIPTTGTTRYEASCVHEVRDSEIKRHMWGRWRGTFGVTFYSKRGYSKVKKRTWTVCKTSRQSGYIQSEGSKEGEVIDL